MIATHATGSRTDRWQPFVSPALCTIEFGATCEAQKFYLHLANESGRAIGLFEMELLPTPSRWGLTLNLKPGTYRYRYYANCGRVTTYVYPGQVDDSPRTMDGLDAIVRVPMKVARGGSSLRPRRDTLVIKGD
jgi:hypothetical protein